MESQEDEFPDDDRGGTTGVATDPVGEGEDSKTGEGNGSGDNGGHEVGRPKRDRKRVFSNAEAIKVKRAFKGKAKEACRNMMKILMQREIENDSENVEEYQDYERELQRVAAKLRRIDNEDRARKFKDNPSELEEAFLEVADHPMFATQPSQEKESSQQEKESSQQETTGDSHDDDFDPDAIDFGSLDLLKDSPVVQQVEEEVACVSLEALDLAYFGDVDLAMTNGTKRKGRPPKPITDPNLTSQTRQRQVAVFRKIFNQWSKRLGCIKADDNDGGLSGRNKLHGLMLNLDNSGPGSTLQAKEKASLGWKLFNGEPVMVVHTVGEEETSWLIERSCLTEDNFTEIRLRFLGRLNFPPAYKMLVFKKDQRLPLDPIRHGWRASLATVLRLTIRDWLILYERQGKEVPKRVYYSFNVGMDGMGQCKDYDQRSKRDYSTKNNFSVVNTLLDVHDADSKVVVYTSDTVGMNSPKNTRPVMQFPAQESDDVTDEVMEHLNPELLELEGNLEKGIPKLVMEVNLPSGKMVLAEVSPGGAHLKGTDGKMEYSLGGMAGGICTCCDVTEAELTDLVVIARGFLINKDIGEAHRIFEELQLRPGSKKVKKRTGDIRTRKGLTHKPKTHMEVNVHCPVLHLKINLVAFIIRELIPRQNSHQKHFFRGHSRKSKTKKVIVPDQVDAVVQSLIIGDSEDANEGAAGTMEDEAGCEFSDEEKLACKEAELEVRRKVQEEFAVTLDASSLPKGKWLDILSPDFAAEKLAGMIHDETKREGFKEFYMRVCATARVLNSQHHRVDVMALRDLGIEAMLAFQRTFPWAHLSPTIHKALAHGWELIEKNGGKGLGSFSECGLEALNKWIKWYREHGSRQCSTEMSYKDVFHRLWQYSSPLLSVFDRKRKSRTKKVIVPDQVDSVVQSLFIGDSEDENEAAAGTMEDVGGRDYDEDFVEALIYESLNQYEEVDRMPTIEEEEDDA